MNPLTKEEIIRFALKIEEEAHTEGQLVQDGELTDLGALVVCFSMISIGQKIMNVWIGGKKDARVNMFSER